MRLTAAQRRHLLELEAVAAANDGDAYWHPANQGERACAEKMASLGLVRGYSLLRQPKSYELTALGRDTARSLI